MNKNTLLILTVLLILMLYLPIYIANQEKEIIREPYVCDKVIENSDEWECYELIGAVTDDDWINYMWIVKDGKEEKKVSPWQFSPSKFKSKEDATERNYF